MRYVSGIEGRRGLLSEYVYFLKIYKMWWLLPILGVIALMGTLVMLSGTQGALLIYALF
jgi:hypothetical protein